ncbi:hypothetical protein Nepgr_014737 [Nepenthes gracilis]|uniref:Uncharacterized protein n=1 Tax=Nepenthes gracilis TaxID=150966 RepID=A0AAD3SMD8_NEPGR|nr:hypothetical protein Nepgr_014737 [Nepenthes gracilis]
MLQLLYGFVKFVQHLSQMGGDDHVLADFAGDLDGVQSAYIDIYAGLILSHLRVHLWLLVGGGNLGVGTWGGSFAPLWKLFFLGLPAVRAVDKPVVNADGLLFCLMVGAAFGCYPAAGSGEVWPFDAGWLTVGAG